MTSSAKSLSLGGIPELKGHQVRGLTFTLGWLDPVQYLICRCIKGIIYIIITRPNHGSFELSSIAKCSVLQLTQVFYSTLVSRDVADLHIQVGVLRLGTNWLTF